MKFADAVYVLHCFRKTALKTSKADLDLAAKRYRIFNAPEPARIGLAIVNFEPGARTNWHNYLLGQTLVVTSGLGWTQGDRAAGAYQQFDNATRLPAQDAPSEALAVKILDASHNIRQID